VSLAFAPVAALLIGLAAGAESDMVAYLVSYYYGLHAYATLFAVGSAIFTIGISLVNGTGSPNPPSEARQQDGLCRAVHPQPADRRPRYRPVTVRGSSHDRNHRRPEATT
jgi:hypothetical protein